jgi:hypothetical protein
VIIKHTIIKLGIKVAHDDSGAVVPVGRRKPEAVCLGAPYVFVARARRTCMRHEHGAHVLRYPPSPTRTALFYR